MSTNDKVLWGSHPEYCNGEPIKLIVGTSRDCKAEEKFRRKDRRWELEICKRGEECSLGLPNDLHEYQDSIELSDIL